MADYYPLISRAVQGLSDQSPEMRGAVFDRARTALLEQLRSLDPPLAEEEIEQEREALDSAIAAIEAEYTVAEAEPDDAGYDAAGEPAEEWRPDSQQDSWRRPPEEPAAAESDYPEPQYLPQHLPPEPEDPGPAMTAREEVDEDEARQPQGFTLPGAKAAGEMPPPPSAPERTTERKRPRVDSVSPRAASGGGLRAAIVAASLVLVIGAIAFVAYWLSNSPADEPAPAPVVEAPPVGEDGKIAERIGGDPEPTASANPQSAAAPAPPASDVGASGQVAVAQRAILYEEDPVNPAGEPRAAAGTAIWNLDPPAAGATDPSLRATVQIPDAAMTLTMTMRRNLDPTLPASHTIELAFSPTQDASRNVRDVGLLHLKDEETIRGAPVAGLPVPVKDNFFLIGLSNIPADIQRNTMLLTTRNWIEIPFRFAAGQRAIVSFEKGASGEQAITRAFQAWDGVATAR